MMPISSIFKISLRALRMNKMRSGLTILGIIIGVSAVITMIAVGSGASQGIKKQIASMGSNLLIIVPGTTTASGVRMGAGTQPTLSVKDAEAIKELLEVKAVAPISSGVAQLVYENRNWSTLVTGSSSSIFSILNWSLAYGRLLTEEDVRGSAKVCVLGDSVAYQLFGDMDPIGKIIRIKGIPFKVVGLLAPKGQSAVGTDQDDVVYVPLTTAQKQLFGTTFPGQVRMIMVQATRDELLDTAQEKITLLLRQRHRIGHNQDDDFSVRNITQMMEAFQTATKILTILLGSIASISLLVGGIGIMNIMLVSVTERTREIGIRMAVGAKTWDIRLQFLIEAMILSLLGGVIGILLGVVAVEMITRLSELKAIITFSSVLLALSFSAIVGIGFGFYPAYKASLLNPIDALRYE